MPCRYNRATRHFHTGLCGKSAMTMEHKIIGSTARCSRRIDYTQHDFSPKINVHGMRTADALSQIQTWIDRALISNHTTLKILHGKGVGILRMEIRRYLQTLPFVKKVYDDHEYCGGAGITVVEIE